MVEICIPHWEVAFPGNFYHINENVMLFKSADVVTKAAKVDLLPKRCVLKYTDHAVDIVTFLGRNDKYLGFALRNKGDLKCIVQPAWLILADDGDTCHTCLEDVIDTVPLRVKRAKSGGTVGYSYWFSTRRKDTIL